MSSHPAGIAATAAVAATLAITRRRPGLRFPPPLPASVEARIVLENLALLLQLGARLEPELIRHSLPGDLERG